MDRGKRERKGNARKWDREVGENLKESETERNDRVTERKWREENIKKVLKKEVTTRERKIKTKRI